MFWALPDTTLWFLYLCGWMKWMEWIVIRRNEVIRWPIWVEWKAETLSGEGNDVEQIHGSQKMQQRRSFCGRRPQWRPLHFGCPRMPHINLNGTKKLSGSAVIWDITCGGCFEMKSWFDFGFVVTGDLWAIYSDKRAIDCACHFGDNVPNGRKLAIDQPV